MPTPKQNLNVLKNGIQRKGIRDLPGDLAETLPTRDHYERWAHYYKRQYSKKKQDPWADNEILELAVNAARDTPMGIVDTVTREYITYWLPEILVFDIPMVDEIEDDRTHLMTYKDLVGQIRHNVLDVLGRIDYGQDRAAQTLASTLKEKAEHRLGKLFLVFEDHLTDEEKLEYDPKQVETVTSNINGESRKPTKPTQESIPEARILDSSFVWRLSDMKAQTKVPSPRKRRYFQIRSSPGPDPSDNGQVWNSPQLDLKRQKFDFTFTSTVKYSQSNEYTVLSPHNRKLLRESNTVDLTGDGDDDDYNSDQNMIRARDASGAASESSTSLRKDSQCILM